MAYEISICIIEWERSKHLSLLLDSIISQIDDEIRDSVEICISDDASTENIKEIVSIYKTKHPHITYFRFEKNMGFDCNHLKVIEISNAPFCWTFGNDDIMLDGALKYMLKEIKENPDIDIFVGDALIYADSSETMFKKTRNIRKPVKDFVFES
ncbi:MAG: glycosyltransferase, partial [Elusimicrobiota bacterium]|nr:glycosyltransferase [Elusimicrobiota bacterium]